MSMSNADFFSIQFDSKVRILTFSPKANQGTNNANHNVYESRNSDTRVKLA